MTVFVCPLHGSMPCLCPKKREQTTHAPEGEDDREMQKPNHTRIFTIWPAPAEYSEDGKNHGWDQERHYLVLDVTNHDEWKVIAGPMTRFEAIVHEMELRREQQEWLARRIDTQHPDADPYV